MSKNETNPRPLNEVSNQFIDNLKVLFGHKISFPKLIEERENNRDDPFIKKFSPFLITLLLFVSDEPELIGHLSKFIEYLPEKLVSDSKKNAISIDLNSLLNFYNKKIHTHLEYHRIFLEFAFRAIHSRLPTHKKKTDDPYTYQNQWELLNKVFGFRVQSLLMGEAYTKRILKISPCNRIHISQGQYQERLKYNLELVLDQSQSETTISLKKTKDEKIIERIDMGLKRDYAMVINRSVDEICQIIAQYETTEYYKPLIQFISEKLLKRVCSDFEPIVQSLNSFGVVLKQLYYDEQLQKINEKYYTAGVLHTERLSLNVNASSPPSILFSKRIIRYLLRLTSLHQEINGTIAVELRDDKFNQANYFLIHDRLSIVESVMTTALVIFLAPNLNISEKRRQWAEQYEIFCFISKAFDEEEYTEIRKPSKDLDQEEFDLLTASLDEIY